MTGVEVMEIQVPCSQDLLCLQDLVEARLYMPLGGGVLLGIANTTAWWGSQYPEHDGHLSLNSSVLLGPNSKPEAVSQKGE